jgi:hypothetical protein
MLDALAYVEHFLPELLQDETSWRSLYVDYHPPIVERLWTCWKGYRIYLHRIHPCERAEALFHPHPWPSAMRVLEGKYEMAVGFGSGMETPPVAALMIARGDFQYEMVHPDSWHYVRPLGEPTFSVMVTGQPWARESHRSTKPLHPLPPDQSAALLQWFRARYPRRAGSIESINPEST